ncbi:MAG: sigma-70 family RNA polymerase sigma factor [Gemmatimonadetes bacterium]|nr:sigma-70 family RNA polymerase sigma factor [Gemmatimonadota bacterium]NNF14706.1 sigma-70 family RNA polymerase sigma factor [Gemmatimonadota bacterium]
MTEFARIDPELSDSELVERGRSGDEAALGALVRRHQDMAYRVALSITRNEDTAMDVVQDGFLKAFRALDGFRGDAAFRTWLGTIVANEARGALRSAKRRRESALDEVGPVASDEKDVSEAVEIIDESSRARRMMEQLPEKQRLSVALRIDEGLSFREIGELIGSSEGAARVNYFHGIRRLRELMQ